MAIRVSLNSDDVELLVKLLKDVNRSTGFPYVATTQRVRSILYKLQPQKYIANTKED